MARPIYYRLMGETVGPITGAELRRKAADGEVMPDTFVRVGEDGEWVRASRLTNLFDDQGRPIHDREGGAGAKHSVTGSGPTSSKSDASPHAAVLIAAMVVVAILALILYFVFR